MQKYSVDFLDLLEARLNRLAKLQGSDAAMFVLAVHSFVESFCRDHFQLEDRQYEFIDCIDTVRDHLLKENRYLPGFGVLKDLCATRDLANQIRHRFTAVDHPMAALATSHLHGFCHLLQIPLSPTLAKVQEYLKLWEERRPTPEILQELQTTQDRLKKSEVKNEEMACQVAKLQGAEKALLHLENQLRILDLQNKEYSAIKNKKEEKIKELRDERAFLTQELKKAQKEIAQYSQAQTYLQNLNTLTLYTRTRGDFERRLTKLSSEQNHILDQISLAKDFLIKGAAGTGKTLVLLKALEKAKKGNLLQPGLDLPGQNSSVALLTYTKTLVKYAEYLATLVKLTPGDWVTTADAFLLERLKMVHPGARLHFDKSEPYLENTDGLGLSAGQIIFEAEHFLWPNRVSREEYIDRMIDRTGMKTPLNRTQRIAVWDGVKTLEKNLRAKNLWPKDLAAQEVYRSLAAGEGKIPQVDCVFIDEAQDLSPAVLAALKAASRRCVIMAADQDQTLYQPTFSFQKSGIAIVGRSHSLKTNFRNTLPIHNLAEAYRKRSLLHNRENLPEAFREGPQPELFQADHPQELQSLLHHRINLYLDRLGYEPENIGILAPTKSDLLQLKAFLEEQGLPLCQINEDHFHFASLNGIRLCTLHSAKGLDFPVVLLYIPKLHLSDGQWDEKTADFQHRNLLYVAITRAMDHCNAFIKTGLTTPAVVDLVEAFGGGKDYVP